MRIVVINLDRDAERRRFMERQGERLGLPLERRAAVEAGAIDPATARRLNGRWERPLSAAELGCFLSHHALWREAAEAAGPLCILEDDAVLSRRLPAALSLLAAREGADLLNLETFDRRRFVARRASEIAPGLAVRRVFRDKSGSAAYLVWPEGARRLLRRTEAGGAAPVDAFLHGLAGLRAWQCEPPMAIQAHLWARRGHPPGIALGTSIQAPRGRLPLRWETLPFHARRLATQLRLAGHHLRRLGPATYRASAFDEADFIDPADQSRS